MQTKGTLSKMARLDTLENENDMFGYELLQKTVNIKKRDDHIVVLFHWKLIYEGFRCIGLGDAKEVSGDEPLSECLPDGWNDNDTYLLRYIKTGKLFLARISKSSSDLIINLIRSEDMKILSVIVTESVADDDGVTKKVELVSTFDKDIVRIFIPAPEPEPKNLSISQPSNAVHLNDWLRQVPPARAPPAVGRSDLDPYGFGQPVGMIYPSPGARGNFGIRYDPLNPGMGPRGQRGEPDFDELRPPGGGYFM